MLEQGAPDAGGTFAKIIGVFLGEKRTKAEVRGQSLLERIPVVGRGVSKLRDVVEAIIPDPIERFSEVAALALPFVGGAGTGAVATRGALGLITTKAAGRATQITTQRLIGGTAASVASRQLAPLGRTAVRFGPPVGAASGAAIASGDIFRPGLQPGPPIRQVGGGPVTMQPFERGGQLPGRDTIVRTWTSNGTPFAKLLDGRIAVQRRDGSIKVYRPQKMIVISRNPKIGSLLRGHKRTSQLLSKIAKQAGMVRRK